MESFLRALRKSIAGTATTEARTRKRLSRDASVYELTPEVVITPSSVVDIEALVKLVLKHKKDLPKLSITPRGAGTDMTGGALSNSLLLDTTSLNAAPILKGSLVHAQPGVYLRDIDPLLAAHNLQLGCAPTSRELCTIGGVVANNAGGEQSLRFGSADKAIRELTVVLGDGKSYTIKPLTKRQLSSKLKETTYEAELYRRVYELIEQNYDTIRNARPHTTKNSMGYNLWSVWDRETGIFDLTQLFTGSQGTLGIITNTVLEAVPKAAHTGLLFAYLPSLKQLSSIIATIHAHRPAAFESFDDITFSLGLRHFRTFRRQLGTAEYLRKQVRLSGSIAKLRGRTPHMILMVEFDGNSESTVLQKLNRLYDDLSRFNIEQDIELGDTSTMPSGNIRRASLALLRTQIHGRYAAPFIDDMAVAPQYAPQFIADLRRVLRKHKLPATIAGHLGDGNFHVIPLKDIAGTKNEAKLEPIMRELLPIVVKYRGTMAGEHNDGMMRGAWLPAVFGREMYDLFRETKEIFDPHYIFNPHKKTDASWEFSASHLKSSGDPRLIK